MVVALLLAAAVATTPAQPLPRSAPTLPGLIETIDLTSPVVSPDGRQVAFRQGRASLNSNRYELTWWVAPTDGSSPPIKVGDGGFALWKSEGVPVVEAPVWSPDSQVIYYRALHDQQVQVWRARSDGSGSAQVTQDDADVDRFVLHGADQLVYAVRATRSQILDIERRLYERGMRIDETVDPSQTLFSAVEINGRMAVERLSGRWFQRDGLAFQTPERFKTIDLASGRVITESPDGGPARPAPRNVFERVKVMWAAPSQRFGQAQIIGSPEGYRLEVVRADGAVVRCEDPACGLKALTWVAWRPGRDELIFGGFDQEHRSVIGAWQVGQVARTLQTTLGQFDGGWPGEPCAVAATSVICVQAEAATPPRLARVDLNTRAVTPLASPNGPSIADPALKVDHLVWRDPQGTVFTGELVAPAVGARTPLFINYYSCGGYLRGGVGDEWPFYAFAKAGIAALCINTTRPPKKALDAVADYDVGLSGVKAVIDLLDRQGRIDRRRVGMGGLSFGTEVTVWVARKSDLLAAASISSVLLEPAYYWLNGVAGRDVHDGLKQAWKLGAPEETPERWRQVSPALSVETFKTPLLMQYPEQEFRPTIEFFARLSNSKTPVDLYVFPQERHVLSQPRHRLAAYERNLDWFRFWLQDYVDPSPEKVEQYARWRGMAKARAAPSM